MQERRRQNLLRVIDGCQEAVGIAFHINNLKHCDSILNYMIKEKITGKKVIDLYLSQDSSVINFCAEIIRRANRQRKKEKIYAGKDYVC
jgi:hypothetical protein